MTDNWSPDELDRIGAADELELAARGARPVTIWVVRDGDELYIRSWRGSAGRWFRAARGEGEGRVSAGGVEKAVDFVGVEEDDVNDAVDAAYRAKYARYADSIVEPMVGPQARATTLKLVPH